MDVDVAKEIFSKYLKEWRLRTTKERDFLLAEIMKTSGHFDADQLYTQVRSRKLKVSRATVYNTLELLVASGLIARYRFGENHARFEKTIGRQRHDHLICLECGDIIEFMNEKLEKVEKEVCQENEFAPKNATMQIFGTCSSCQAKKKHHM